MGRAVLAGVVLASVSCSAQVRHHAGTADRPRSRLGPAPRAHPAVPARRVGAVRPERPLTSRLPSGKVVRVRPVAIHPDGSLAVPTDIRVAGWWRGGSRLGDPFGSLLLAAHVDSFTQGLGPYAELLSLRPGDRVVLRSAYLHESFAVSALRLVPQGSLRGEPWIFSARGPLRLTLVTCAGPYEPAHGGYQNLAVITARPVGPPMHGGVR